MRHDPQAVADRDSLLNKLKARYEAGAMRPRLYETPVYEDGKASGLRLQWMGYAGMGDVAFLDVQPKDQLAAEELLESGAIVRAGSEYQYGIGVVQRICLLEDLNWGLIEGGKAVIYDFSHMENGEDEIIHPDKNCDAAIEELRRRIHYGKAFADAPFKLTDGTPIVPVHFDRHREALQTRQLDFALHAA